MFKTPGKKNPLSVSLSPSPPTERRHCVHPLPVLPGGEGLGLWGSHGGHRGPTGGVRTGVRGRRRARHAQTLSQAHERHREAAQSHPGAGGHGEVLREGERRGCCCFDVILFRSSMCSSVLGRVTSEVS